ncbi:MAG TPA: HAD-IIA family hydrolase [Candidatus Limnocylindrales bacterium]|nr:HAD-IIA family hydrolase [Candidatus Limnocylindrales bacterium]
MTTATGGGRAVRPAERRYPGYVLDLDGTVYLGGSPLPGAVDAIGRLRALGSRFVFLSNNPLWAPAAYAEKLRAMGIPVEDREVVSSIDALLAYLGDRPPERILAICEPLLTELLGEAGYALTDDPRAADAVVLSWDRGFTYDKLHAAYVALRNGARLIATNPDPYCPTPEGGLPDCGALLAAVEVASGVRAEAVVGKPSVHIARAALSRLGVPAGDALMVGDRVLTDVGLARAAGMTAALVLTGATALGDVPPPPHGPDLVLEGLGQLIPPSIEGSPS